MKLFLLFLVLTFATVLEAGPTIIVSPNNIILGMTKQMIVECAIDAEQKSAIKLPLSIKVTLKHPSRNQLTTKNQETIIARLSKIEGLYTLTDEKIRVSAQLNASEISFVHITIDNPSLDNAGVYKCEVSGVDKHEKHVSLLALKQVNTTIPTIPMVLEEFNKLKEKLDELSTIVNNDNTEIKLNLIEVVNEIQKLKTEIPKHSNRSSHSKLVDKIASDLNEIKLVTTKNEDFLNKLHRFAKVCTILRTSDTYDKKRYLLIRPTQFFNPRFGQTICDTFGGILFEKTSIGEFEFARDFIKSSGTNLSRVMFGGTHVTYKATDVYELSADEDCQEFAGDEEWNIKRVKCEQEDVAFICEVPE